MHARVLSGLQRYKDSVSIPYSRTTGAYLVYNQQGNLTGVNLNTYTDYAYSTKSYIYKLEAKKVDLWYLSF